MSPKSPPINTAKRHSLFYWPQNHHILSPSSSTRLIPFEWVMTTWQGSPAIVGVTTQQRPPQQEAAALPCDAASGPALSARQRPCSLLRCRSRGSAHGGPAQPRRAAKQGSSAQSLLSSIEELYQPQQIDIYTYTSCFRFVIFNIKIVYPLSTLLS
jgi:hypothetical protein